MFHEDMPEDGPCPREVTFRFSHPLLPICRAFEPMVHAAMIEYMAACSAYVPFESMHHPSVGFTASNGVEIELDWPGRNQHLTSDDDALALTGEDLALIAEEERHVANAKPNPARAFTPSVTCPPLKEV